LGVQKEEPAGTKSCTSDYVVDVMCMVHHGAVSRMALRHNDKWPVSIVFRCCEMASTVVSRGCKLLEGLMLKIT
jgi:hypothetical protein